MKKIFVLAILSSLCGLLSGCKSSGDEDIDDVNDPTYVSIKDLTVAGHGATLAQTPLITWKLGFPLFATLEAGLSTSASGGVDDAAPWTDIGVVTSHRMTGLSLNECTSYYPMIRARNSQGSVLDTHVSPIPFLVDVTLPTTPASLVVVENATSTVSSLVSWAASTDNCELAGYRYAIGTSAGDTNVLNWSAVNGVSHRASSGVSLSYGTEYYTSVKALDTAAHESAVATTAAWRLRSPSALLTATQTVASTDFNAGTSYVRWGSAVLNSEFFSHSLLGAPEALVVQRAGDYSLSLTMPLQMTSGCAARCSVRAMVVVNGVPLTEAFANSSYLINASSYAETSNHMTAYLQNLSAGDEIKIYVEKGTPTVGVMVTEGVQLYVEAVFADRDFFVATATQSLTSSNLNLAAEDLSWTPLKTSGNYSHNGGSPGDITLTTAGHYLLSVNLPLAAVGACTTRNNVKIQILIDGVMVSGGQANQGGMDCQGGHTTGSAHWFGVLPHITANQVLNISVVQESGVSNIGIETGKAATLILQKLTSIDQVIRLTGTRTVGSTNFNTTVSPIQWSAQQITNPAVYTHSTVSNSHQITVLRSGSYLLNFSDHLTTTTVRANVRIRVQKNGADIAGALCTSNIITNSNNNNEGTCSLQFYLNSVNAGDVITVTAAQEAAAATVTAASPATLSLLRVR